MIFDRTVGLFLQPMRPALPFRRLLNLWIQEGFEPRACRAALEKLIAERHLPRHFFDPAAIERGGLAATDALLFDDYATTERFGFVVMRNGKRVWLTICNSEKARTLAELVRAAAQLDDIPAFRSRFAGQIEPELLDLLCATPPDRSAAPLWPAASRPGIYRREHASLMIRSRDASLLLDPLSLALWYFPPALAGAPTNLAVPRLDGVAITHTHDDHWHLPSVLLHAQSRDMPVIVPQVPTVSILSPEDPAATLRLAGQRAESPPWDSTVTIGDIEIDILPFYGEQPTRQAPGPVPELRNWGNCYRFNTPDFSALVLVDSGADPAGDMEQVVARSTERRGPADVLLSCVQEFPSPFFGGVATECLTLPFARLRELFEELKAGRMPSTTAGPGGILRLCRASGARYFLPYANGFAHLGRPNGIDWGYGPTEHSVVDHLNQVLTARGTASRALGWNPGDAAVFTQGEIAIAPYAVP